MNSVLVGLDVTEVLGMLQLINQRHDVVHNEVEQVDQGVW